MPSAMMVVIACLAGDCQPYVLTPAPMPLQQCELSLVAEAEKWRAQHPGEHLLSINCVEPGRLATFLDRSQA